MYSYGYKVPGIQDRIARERQLVTETPPTAVEPTAPSTPAENVPPPAPQRSLSPREFFESQILPQVRAVIGSSGVNDAYILRQREANEIDNLRRIEEADKQALERLRGTPVPITTQLPETISYKGLGSAGLLGSANFQPGIPGLFGQVETINEELEGLRKQKTVEAFNDLLTKYPELNRVLYTDPGQRGKALRVRKEGFKPYLDYVDRKQVFSSPEARADLYNEIIKDYESLGDNPESTAELNDALRTAEQDYTSGDTARQTVARQFLQNILQDPQKLEAIETPSFRESRPVIGGGGYVPTKDNPIIKKINQRAKAFNSLYGQLGLGERQEIAKVFPGLRATRESSGDKTGFYLDPDTREVFTADFDDPEAYAVEVNRYFPGNVSLEEIDDDILGPQVSENALRFLADYPVTAKTDITFATREPGFREPGYGAKILPPELVNPVTSFVADAAFRNLRPGTIVTNNPLSSSDLLDKRIEEGKSIADSNVLRRLQPFIDTNSQLPNLRGLAYTSAGFGPVDSSGSQISYVDEKGQAIPIQLGRPEGALRGRVAVSDLRGASVYTPALPASATPRYYAADPVSGALVGGAKILRNLRRTPSALLPGVADLIPSPEAIRTGYSQGPAAMGKQMAQEFTQSLPIAAGAAMLLSAPPIAPLAPGIGAGLVGIAGTRALNEVVRQETGEGVVPKVRQFLGTASRTGVSAKPRVGEQPLAATVKPLTSAQRSELQRQQNRNELQRRIDLVQERFNPRRGEFGLSELLFGR